jgi:hypothetical protein
MKSTDLASKEACVGSIENGHGNPVEGRGALRASDTPFQLNEPMREH